MFPLKQSLSNECKPIFAATISDALEIRLKLFQNLPVMKLRRSFSVARIGLIMNYLACFIYVGWRASWNETFGLSKTGSTCGVMED